MVFGCGVNFMKLHEISYEISSTMAKDTAPNIQIGGGGVGIVVLVQAMRSKPLNQVVRDQFKIRDGAKETKKKIYKCTHCKVNVQTVATFNVTRGGTHLLGCSCVPESIKAEVRNSSQKSKKAKKTATLVTSVNSTLGSESATEVRAGIDLTTPSNVIVSGRPISSASSLRRTPSKQMSLRMFRQTLSWKEADRLIRGKVEAVVARFEPLTRLVDPFVKAAFIQKSPAIASFLPEDVKTIYSNFVDPIDAECTKQVIDIFKRNQSMLTGSVNGVTVNKRHKLLYSVSKGSYSLFEKIQSLGAFSHVESAEVEDGLKIFCAIVKKYGVELNNVAVDNKVVSVMQKVIENFQEIHPLSTIIITRDPGHCIDLLAKDTAHADFMKAIMELSKAINHMMSIDRIAGIVDDMVSRSMLLRPIAPKSLPETFFYFAPDVLKSSITQKTAIGLLRDDDNYKTYYASQITDAKAKLDAVINKCTPLNFRTMQRGVKLFTPFKHANKVTSSRATPMSAYLLLTQALRNELNVVIKFEDSGNFKDLFGDNASNEICGLLKVRFNMKGKKPQG